jgi:hypothetical protein
MIGSKNKQRRGSRLWLLFVLAVFVVITIGGALFLSSTAKKIADDYHGIVRDIDLTRGDEEMLKKGELPAEIRIKLGIPPSQDITIVPKQADTWIITDERDYTAQKTKDKEGRGRLNISSSAFRETDKWELFLFVIILLLFFYAVTTLPMLMVLGYQGTQRKMLLEKVREDLWLCGLKDRELQARIKEYGERNSWGAFLLPMLVNLVLMWLMWVSAILPGGMENLTRLLIDKGISLQSAFSIIAANLSPVSWAFLGAYFYIVMVLIRRWMQSDITTNVLWKLNVRIVVALIIGLLLMKIPPTPPEKAIQAFTFLVAFFAGIVPDTVLRWLVQQMKAAVNLQGKEQVKRVGSLEREVTDKLFMPSNLQENIDGLNFWQVDRLFEEGIESVQDLAMKEIPRLLICTRFDTPLLLSWVDQALLCNQVGEDVTLFKAAYIKTASDLLQLVEHKQGLEDVLQAIHDAQPQTLPNANTTEKPEHSGRANSRITLPMLENLVVGLQNGPNLAYVRAYWHNTSTPEITAEKLERGGDQ